MNGPHMIEDDLVVDMGWILVAEIEHYLAKVARFQMLFPDPA